VSLGRLCRAVWSNLQGKTSGTEDLQNRLLLSPQNSHNILRESPRYLLNVQSAHRPELRIDGAGEEETVRFECLSVVFAMHS